VLRECIYPASEFFKRLTRCKACLHPDRNVQFYLCPAFIVYFKCAKQAWSVFWLLFFSSLWQGGIYSLRHGLTLIDATVIYHCNLQSVIHFCVFKNILFCKNIQVVLLQCSFFVYKPKQSIATFRLECPMPFTLCAPSHWIHIVLHTPFRILPAPIDTLYIKTVGIQHSIWNMALIKFVYSKFLYVRKFYKMFIFFRTMTSINIRPSPSVTHCWHASACHMHLHAKFHRHTSCRFRGDRGRTRVRQLSIII